MESDKTIEETTTEETITDNPIEESETIEQPEIGLDRYKDIFQESKESLDDEGGTQKSEEKEPDKANEQPDKKIDDEHKLNDEEYTFDNDKLVISKGEIKQELIKVELPDGGIAYVPENLKGGYLMQSDYTRKTQELKAEKERLAKEKEQVEQIKKTVEQLRFIDLLGTPPQSPSIKDYLDPEGKLYNDYENEVEARIAYEEAREKYLEDKEIYAKKEAMINSNKQIAFEKNQETGRKFIEKYGQAAFDKTINALNSFNDYVIRGLSPLPDNALDIIYKGLIFDEEIKKAELKAKESAFDVGKSKQEANKVIKGTKTISNPVNSAIPDRYKGIMEEATRYYTK